MVSVEEAVTVVNPPLRAHVLRVLGAPRTRLVLLASVVVGATAFFAVSGGVSHDSVRVRVEAAGIAGPLVFIVIYALLTVLLVPGSVLTVAAGAVFGAGFGTVYAVIGASLGAVAAFAIGRRLGREAVETLAGKRVGDFDAWLQDRGFVAVLYARLIPLLPFNALNYAIGVTSVPLRVYTAATVVGIVPGTFAFAALGGSFSDPGSPAFVVAVGLIVILLIAGPVVTRLARGRRQSSRAERSRVDGSFPSG